MTALVPSAEAEDEEPRALMLCITDDPAEQARVAAALGGTGVLVMVPDRRSALRLLADADGDDHRESARERPEVMRFGELVVDPRRASVTWDERPIDLSHLEIKVLACLAESPGVVWSYERLHQKAWGSQYIGDRDSMYSLVKRLRRKLGRAGAGVDVHSVRGVGFQLVGLAGPAATQI